jgi:hypothetical protein
MTTAITNATSDQSTASAKAQAPNSKAAQAKPQSAPPKAAGDTVQLSQAAQAAAAAMKEVRETPAQTATEAIHGDLQAKRLLAKDTATKLNNKV